jgi:hypothetical protein
VTRERISTAPDGTSATGPGRRLARTRTAGRRSVVVAALGAAALSVALGACSTPVPSPQPPVSASAQPALSLDQDTAVLAKVGDVLTVADKKRDGKALDQRLSGPALAMRTAELRAAKTRGSDADVTDLPTSVQTVVVPTDTTWPRVAYAVSTQPSKDEPPRLMAFVQKSARDPYSLWGWARLFPGTTMPTFPDAATGTQSVDAADASLVVTPTQAIAHYVDALNKGSKSTYASAYATDPFRTTIASTAKKWTGNKGFKSAKGSYGEKFTAAKTPVVALRTSDGGALVIADASAVEKISAEKGAKITPPNPVEAALFGKTKPTNKLSVTYRDVIAAYVPPKDATGSDAKVKVLGVEHVPVTVTAR